MTQNDNAVALYNSTFLLNQSHETCWITDASSIIHGIADPILLPGLIGLDLADIKTTLHNAGETLMGTGTAQGPDRTVLATRSALSQLARQSSNFFTAKNILVSSFDGTHAELVELHRGFQIIGSTFNNEPDIMVSQIPDDEMGENFVIKIYAGRFSGLNCHRC